MQMTHPYGRKQRGTKEPLDEGDTGDGSSIPGLGRCPAEGNGNSLQYSSLENPMGRRAWQATIIGVTRVGHNLVNKPPPVTVRSDLEPKKIVSGIASTVSPSICHDVMRLDAMILVF